MEVGENAYRFEVDRSFFEVFEGSPIEEGEVKLDLKVQKFTRHLDALFQFRGSIVLHCDRCLEPYSHQLEFDQRIIYSFDEDQEFESDEVIHLDEHQFRLSLAPEIYDFIALQVPLRKVPSPEVHVCPQKYWKCWGW